MKLLRSCISAVWHEIRSCRCKTSGSFGRNGLRRIFILLFEFLKISAKTDISCFKSAICSNGFELHCKDMLFQILENCRASQNIISVRNAIKNVVLRAFGIKSSHPVGHTRPQRFIKSFAVMIPDQVRSIICIQHKPFDINLSGRHTTYIFPRITDFNRIIFIYLRKVFKIVYLHVEKRNCVKTSHRLLINSVVNIFQAFSFSVRYPQIVSVLVLINIELKRPICLISNGFWSISDFNIHECARPKWGELIFQRSKIYFRKMQSLLHSGQKSADRVNSDIGKNNFFSLIWVIPVSISPYIRNYPSALVANDKASSPGVFGINHCPNIKAYRRRFGFNRWQNMGIILGGNFWRQRLRVFVNH